MVQRTLGKRPASAQQATSYHGIVDIRVARIDERKLFKDQESFRLVTCTEQFKKHERMPTHIHTHLCISNVKEDKDNAQIQNNYLCSVRCLLVPAFAEELHDSLDRFFS